MPWYATALNHMPCSKETKGIKVLQYFKVYLPGSESHTILLNTFTVMMNFCSFINIAFYASHLNRLFIAMHRFYRKEPVKNLFH